MMATRVSLLLLVTGLFAGMWSGDRPDTQTAAEKILARRGSSPCAIPCSVGNQTNGASAASSAAFPAGKTPRLPTGIINGAYLVVDQLGRTNRITVSTGRTARRQDRTVDQYVIREGENRWHFIRLQLPSESLLAHPQRSRPASALH